MLLLCVGCSSGTPRHGLLTVVLLLLSLFTMGADPARVQSVPKRDGRRRGRQRAHVTARGGRHSACVWRRRVVAGRAALLLLCDGRGRRASAAAAVASGIVSRGASSPFAGQGCMNNITFGDATLGYYETVAGGAGAGPSWHGRSGVHTHMTNTRITDVEARGIKRIPAWPCRGTHAGSGPSDFGAPVPGGARVLHAPRRVGWPRPVRVPSLLVPSLLVSFRGRSLDSRGF